MHCLNLFSHRPVPLVETSPGTASQRKQPLSAVAELVQKLVCLSHLWVPAGVKSPASKQETGSQNLFRVKQVSKTADPSGGKLLVVELVK